jgi:hypothetical protein
MPGKFILPYGEQSRGSQLSESERLVDAIAVCRRVIAIVLPVIRSALNL